MLSDFSKGLSLLADFSPEGLNVVTLGHRMLHSPALGGIRGVLSFRFLGSLRGARFLLRGPSALDLFQAAGSNQDTILVTSSITLQLTPGSNWSETEGDGPLHPGPSAARSRLCTARHFPSQKGRRSGSTPARSPAFFLPQECSGVSLVLCWTSLQLHAGTGNHDCPCSAGNSVSQHHGLASLDCSSPPAAVSSSCLITHVLEARSLPVRTDSMPHLGASSNLASPHLGGCPAPPFRCRS